jgi:hypothetical protein
MAIENLKNHFILTFLIFFLFKKISPIKKGWLTFSNIKILLVLFSFFCLLTPNFEQGPLHHQIATNTICWQKCQICGELSTTTLNSTKFISYHGFRDRKSLNERYINLTSNPIVMLRHGFYLMARKTILKMVTWAWHVHNTSH